jgi:tetratricopeptide (TPR) repeat protein
MATSRVAALLLLLLPAVAGAREAATAAACQAAGARPPIAGAKAAAAADPAELKLTFALADAWSDAGCFTDAVLALSEARSTHPNDHELLTRLRVAHSVVGEESFFDNLDQAEEQARLKRNLFRCNSLADLDACSAAVRQHPDSVEALTAQGDALAKAGQPQEAAASYRQALAITPGAVDLAARLTALPAAATARGGSSGVVVPASANAAVARTPRPAAAVHVVRQYSNVEPESQSH